jgi:hypothetical protein
MEEIVHCSNVHYAIIQTSNMKDHPERLVIAYPDENCLRDLIAGPSIVGLGFTSREDALGKTRWPRIERRFEAKHHPTNMSYEAQHKSDSVRGGRVKNKAVCHGLLQYALSTVTVLFYSKNLASVVIRMALEMS